MILLNVEGIRDCLTQFFNENNFFFNIILKEFHKKKKKNAFI